MNEDIKILESEYYGADNSKKWGMYISIAGVIAFIANSVWGWSDSPVFVGIVIGGGLTGWAVSYEKARKLRNRLDNICMSKYGKPYKDSFIDILNDK
ncbi:hypothetical protein ACYYHG_000112 [Morganella morganii]